MMSSGKLSRRGRVQTPGRIIGKTISQESDETPEPSPPPQWRSPEEDLCLPSAPSPYSPPPHSLLSGEEFPPKTIRKPMAEVHLQSGGSNRGSTLKDLSLNHHLLPDGIRQRLYSPAPATTVADRSQLLYLKKDLEDSYQSLFLLQQENKALAAECDRFEAELARYQQASEEAKRNSENRERTMKETVRNAKEEAEKLSNELLASKATIARREEEQRKLQAQAQDLQNEVKDLRGKLKEQASLSAQKLKEATEEHDATVAKLKEKIKSSQLENDRLQAMLREAQKKNAKNDAADEEMETELIRLQAALSDAEHEIEELRCEKIAIESEYTRAECTMQEEIDRLKAELSNEAVNENIVKNEITQELESLKQELATSHADKGRLEEQVKQLQDEFNSERTAMQKEIDRLQTALVKASEDKQTRTQFLENSLKEIKEKYNRVSAEKDSLQKKLSINTTSPSHANRKTLELEDEIKRLQEALHHSNTKNLELRSEKSALTRELAQAKLNRARSGDVSVLTSTQPEDSDDVVPDRLSRIRDAAERAALVKEHRREMARLKAEHEAEIKRLGTRHDQDLKEVFEEAKSEVSALARENRRRLQAEYEAKVQSLERRYQSDIAKIQRECDKSTAVIEEAMRSAEKEAAEVTEQLNKESQARESLEGTVRELERKLAMESQKGRLASQHMKTQKQWQEETNNLIASIQHECNEIFQQNMVSTTSDSPRTVMVADDSSILEELSTFGATKSAGIMKPSTTFKEAMAFTPYKPSLEVDKALEETEALVRSLMGN